MEEAEPGRNPWRLRIALLTLAHVLGTLHLASLGAMAPAIRVDLELSYTELGLLVSAYNGCGAPGALFSGMVADRLGVGQTIALSLVLVSVATVLFTQADGLALALVATGLMGVGYSFLNPATARGVLQWFPPERRATAMGMKQTGVPLGYVVAAGNGALLVWFDWRTLMWVSAGLTLVGAVLSLLISTSRQGGTRSRAGNPFRDFMTVLRSRNLNLINLTTSFWNIGQQSFFLYLVTFMRDAAQASQPVAATIMSLAHIGGAVGRLGWGIVSDRFFRGRRRTLLIILGMIATGALFLMMTVGPGWGVWVGGAVAIVLGLTVCSFAGLVQTSTVESIDPALAGTAVGYHVATSSIAGMVGPWMFGMVVDHAGGFPAAWAMAGVLCLLGTALLFLTRAAPRVGIA